MKGWECPKCGACYAPAVSQCFNCVGVTAQPLITPKVEPTVIPPYPVPPNRTDPYPGPVTPWYPRWPGDGPSWQPGVSITCKTDPLALIIN